MYLLQIHLIPSEEYMIEKALLTAKLRGQARPVLVALGEALDRLKETGWGSELAIRQIGGNKFAYPFTDTYEVTFRIRDQRPSIQPTEMWLELLTIPIRKRR
jgi:hypothetical protein